MSDDDDEAAGDGSTGDAGASGSNIPAAADSSGRAASPPLPFAAQCENAHRHFVGKLQAAWLAIDVRQTLAESEQELGYKLLTLTGPARELERFEAATEHLRLVRRSRLEERFSAKVAFAFSQYIEELRAIWSRPDVGEIDPRLLSQLGESLAWAGFHAASHAPTATPGT